MNKQERHEALDQKIAQDIRTCGHLRINYTEHPDCYITTDLWGMIRNNIDHVSRYWLRQYILECVMDIVFFATGVGTFDPYELFPPESTGECMEIYLHLLADEYTLRQYYDHNNVGEAIKRYMFLSGVRD